MKRDRRGCSLRLCTGIGGEHSLGGGAAMGAICQWQG